MLISFVVFLPQTCTCVAIACYASLYRPSEVHSKMFDLPLSSVAIPILLVVSLHIKAGNYSPLSLSVREI